VPNTSPVRSYRDLIVWQRAMMLVEECYRVTSFLPARECYGLAAQIRRAAASVPANIAEGHGSVYRRQYMRYVMIAQGSVRELETHLEITVRVRLLEGRRVAEAIRLCDETGRMLRSLYAALTRYRDHAERKSRSNDVRSRRTVPGHGDQGSGSRQAP
jgi:four helix bundle protein